jgi:hypothetical protein
VYTNAKLSLIRFARTVLVVAVVTLAFNDARANAEAGVSSDAPKGLECRLGTSEVARAREKKSLVICDYRYEPSFKPGQLTLDVAGTTLKLDRKNIKKYPAEGQRTALLAMFDVSDPRRNTTTSGFYPKIVGALAENRPAHLQLGIATFAQSLDISFPLQPLTSTSLLDNLPFSASGAATELNRAALIALKRLDEKAADRKILVVVSDGKAEDTTYTVQYVISEARKRRIPIVAVGIAERPSETPSLQLLRVLAEESGGAFFDFSDKEIPADLQGRVLSLVEVGGRVAFDGSAHHGKQMVSITLIDAGKKTIKVQTEFEFPDFRDTPAKVKDFLAAYWYLLVFGSVGFIGALWIYRQYRRRSRQRQIENRLVAEFRGLDGDETRYEVRRAAVTLGRSSQNDIVIKNSSVSGRHAELHRTSEGVFRLSDLGSTNGTLVNGARITAMDLHDGDIVEIAEVRFYFKVFE